MFSVKFDFVLPLTQQEEQQKQQEEPPPKFIGGGCTISLKYDT